MNVSTVYPAFLPVILFTSPVDPLHAFSLVPTLLGYFCLIICCSFFEYHLLFGLRAIRIRVSYHVFGRQLLSTVALIMSFCQSYPHVRTFTKYTFALSMKMKISDHFAVLHLSCKPPCALLAMLASKGLH